ncbi:hypothetical protein D3C85_753570 [compost metagenome]
MNASIDKQVLRSARVAGLAYLIVIFAGLFAQLAVFQPLTHASAVATAEAIATNGGLWRLGIAINILGLIANVPLGVILYGFFYRQRPTLARCALAFILICTAIEAGNLLLLYVPLAIGSEGEPLGAMAEWQALAYVAIRLHTTGLGLALLFFAGFCVLTGILIFLSRIAPRALGVLMVLAGICYALNTLAMVVAPGLWSMISPGVLVPCLVAEASLAVWLLVKGADAPTMGPDAKS